MSVSLKKKHRLGCYSKKRLGLVLFCSGLVNASLAGVAVAGVIEGINHTHWAINRFSVNGRSALDAIGAYQGGGGGCCYVAPKVWQPGMTVLVEWETGVSSTMDFPGFGDRSKYLAWRKAAEDKKRSHSREVSVPNYLGQEVCGITVHFLPCDELQVTTSCHSYGTAQYPIKTPLRVPEPQLCPM